MAHIIIFIGRGSTTNHLQPLLHTIMATILIPIITNLSNCCQLTLLGRIKRVCVLALSTLLKL